MISHKIMTTLHLVLSFVWCFGGDWSL